MENGNIALARKACEHESGDYHAFLDIAADDIVCRFTIPDGAPVSGEFRGKQAVVDLFTKTNLEVVRDVRVTKPLEYFASGDRVVAIGEETYLVVKTGLTAARDVAIVLDFREGLITSVLVIEDCSAITDAYRSS